MSNNKKNKPLSHFERMNSATPIYEVPTIERYTFTRKKTVDESTGVISYKIEKTKVVKNRFEHLKPSDFALENLLAAGASLSPCSLRMDIHETTSMIENGLSSVVSKLEE